MRQLCWLILVSALVLPGLVGCSKKEPTKPTVAYAGFREDFNPRNDGMVDPTTWNVSPGDGSVGLSDGKLTLSSFDGGNFPYLTTKANPFPTEGDFVLTVGVRFVYPGGGVGFGPNYWVRGGFWIWYDYNGFSADVGDSSVSLDRHDQQYHVFEWRHVGGTYSLKVDGESKGSYQSDFRPTSLFIGHPPQAIGVAWTLEEIDFVHVDPL